jgi:hypothetical protein
MSGMGDPTSSYATAGIALTVSGALKPHHHGKVETPSVGLLITRYKQITGNIVITNDSLYEIHTDVLYCNSL